MFFFIFYQINNLFLHQSYLKKPTPSQINLIKNVRIIFYYWKNSKIPKVPSSVTWFITVKIVLNVTHWCICAVAALWLTRHCQRCKKLKFICRTEWVNKMARYITIDLHLQIYLLFNNKFLMYANLTADRIWLKWFQDVRMILDANITNYFLLDASSQEQQHWLKILFSNVTMWRQNSFCVISLRWHNFKSCYFGPSKTHWTVGKRHFNSLMPKSTFLPLDSS